MKVLIFLLGYFLATLAQNVIVLNDINSIPICATLNNVNKTFINIWQIYEEFKTTGQIWTPVTTGACPQNNIDCTVLNPVCAVSSYNFFKTFPNRCVLETEQKTTGTVWNIVFNGICFVNQDDTYSTSPMLSKIYPATSPVSSIYDKVLVPPRALREYIQPYSSSSYGAVSSPPVVHYKSAPQKLHSPQYPPPYLDSDNNIPMNYNPAPTPQPYAPSYIPENYNQSVVQLPEIQAPFSLYSSSSINSAPKPATDVYNSTPEPLPPSTYTVPSPISDSYYQAPEPVPSSPYLSPSNYTVLSPDPVPAIVDPFPEPVDYNTDPTPQPYAPAIKIHSCDHIAAPASESYNPEPLHSSSYPTPSAIPGNYNQSVVQVPEEQAPLSLYSSPSIDSVPTPLTNVYNSPPEPPPPSNYTASSPISDSYYKAPELVPSPSYLSPSNYTLFSSDPVPLTVPIGYNAAPNPQSYAPTVEIPSSDYNPSPGPGHYNPEPLPSPSYPVPPHIPEKYNQPVKQTSLSLYSSPSIDTVSKPVNDVYNSPPEPMPPSTYTVPSPISGSYYQAPAPDPSPPYLSPSNYTVLSPDPVPAIVDPFSAPVDYNTAPAPQPYPSAIKILSCDQIASPAPGSYNPEPLYSSSYPAPSAIPGNYNERVVQVPEEQAPLSLYSSPSIDSVPTPVTNVYNSPPEPPPPSNYTASSPISDSYYKAPELVPSPSYLSPSNYTLLSSNPVHLTVPVGYNAAPNPQSYAPTVEIPSSDYNPSPGPGHYNPEPLPSPSYPVPPHIPEKYNQPVKQTSLSLYSSPSIDTVSKPVNDVYNSPPEPMPPSTYTVPSPISGSYYQAPAPDPSPPYLSPSNYTVLSPDPVPAIVDPFSAPVDYNTAPAPQPYPSAIKILSCDQIASPAPGSYNPEPLHSSSYPAPSAIPGNYNERVVQVPEEQAPLSLYSSSSIDSVPTPVTNVYNSPPEPPPPSNYTASSPISDSYYKAPELVPSPSYLSPSNYTLLSSDPVPLTVPIGYNAAPNPQSYAPTVEIPSSDYNPSPGPGHYNPEPLPSPSYPVPPHIPEKYNQPVKQTSLSLYSSPSIDTVSKPVNDVYNSPPEPMPPSTYTVPSPISGSYYQAPAPDPSPPYLSPSNYTVLSPDPVPAIVDPFSAPVDYNTAPAPQPYPSAIKILSCDQIASPAPGSYNPEPSAIPGNYNEPVVQVPEEQAHLSLYSSPSIDSVPTPVTNVYNSPPEPPPPSNYTASSPIPDSYYKAPEPVPSPSYLSPSNYTVLSPDPVPAIVDPFSAPVDYNTAPAPQPYPSAIKILSCDQIASPAPGSYNPEPLHSSSYPAPSAIPGNYNEPVVQVPEEQAPLSLYSSPSIDSVPTPVTNVYNSPPEPPPPSNYTASSPIPDSYYKAPEPVPSPSYLSPSNYTLLSSNPVHLTVPVGYNTAPNPQSYVPTVKIPSSDYNPSPGPGHYNPEPLPPPSYPVPPHIPEKYNQPVKQTSLSLYSSPSIDTVSKPVNDVYNSPPEPLPPSTYTVPSPISGSYYQAPAPDPSPPYLSPSNYTVLSPDPVPAIVDPFPAPVDYNTAPAPQTYPPAIKILSCDQIASPAPGSYNPAPLHSSSYPAPSAIPGNYNEPVVQVQEEQAPLSLYSSPSIDSVPTPVTNVYNSPPEPPPPSNYTASTPISDSYYKAPEPVPSPSYLSPSNYTLLSSDPVHLTVPVGYNTAPNPQSYAPTVEIPSSDYNPSPGPGHYDPEPLPSPSYPVHPHIPEKYNQPVKQTSLSLYSSPSIDTVSKPVNDVYNSPPEPLPPSTYTVPSPISGSYYQAPKPVPSPSYLSPSNYTVLSPDLVPAIVDPFPAPIDYNTVPTPHSYAPANEIPSSDYNPLPLPGPYNPEQSSYSAPSLISGNYNQPVVQVPEEQAPLSLYPSPSIDSVPTPVTNVYNSPPEPLPSSNYTAPSPISGSYYQAPKPVPSPSYLSPSNYTLLSPDPVPAIVDPLPVSVDYSTASKPQSDYPAIEIPSRDYNPSPAPEPYNPKTHIPAQEPPPPSTYPVPYNQVSVHSPAPYSPALDPLALPSYSAPSSNPSDYKEPFVEAPVSSYSLPIYNHSSSHVLGDYNSALQTSYAHNDSSAGTVNYNLNLPAASPVPVPDPYNPFTEPPTTPSYPLPSPIPLYEPILSDPVPHYLPPLPASTAPPAVDNQYTTLAITTKYSSPSISNPVPNAYALSDSDKIPYKPVQNYQQSSNINSAPSKQPYNSFSADTPSQSQTYQQLSNITYSPPETSNAYAEESAPDVGPCSNVETFSSPVLDYQNIPSYSQIYKGIPLAGKNYSDKPNNKNIVKSHLPNQSDYNTNSSPSYDKPKGYNEAKIEHSRQSANNEGQTIYNGVVYQGPYYYIPQYKHINYGNFNFLPSQNLSPAPVPFAPAIPALVSAYPYVGTAFSGFSTNPFEQLLKQLQYIATKN